MDNNFFQEQREQSQIKARIVAKYFSAWANVILGTQKKIRTMTQKMAYIDLFAGPGRYNDQSKSTPLLVLETILSSPDLSQRMLTLFNDKDNIESLKNAIRQLGGIDKLKYTPIFYNEEVGDEIIKLFENYKNIPTFFFVDPWGYKGLSLDLISAIIRNWGCDCVFFFNYNRVNMGVGNDAVRQHMTSLFGTENLTVLRKECRKVRPGERETIVVQALCDALKCNGSNFVLPFRFKNEQGNRTSHHLIFLSKNFLGYEIMKDIMHKESTSSVDGVASFEYNPKDMLYQQGSLLDMLSCPLDDLKSMLLREFAGREIGFRELYQMHSVNRPFIKKNYKDTLSKMYQNGEIIAKNRKTGKPPRENTFSDDMIITFGGAI